MFSPSLSPREHEGPGLGVGWGAGPGGRKLAHIGLGSEKDHCESTASTQGTVLGCASHGQNRWLSVPYLVLLPWGGPCTVTCPSCLGESTP